MMILSDRLGCQVGRSTWLSKLDTIIGNTMMLYSDRLEYQFGINSTQVDLIIGNIDDGIGKSARGLLVRCYVM